MKCRYSCADCGHIWTTEQSVPCWTVRYVNAIKCPQCGRWTGTTLLKDAAEKVPNEESEVRND